MKHPTAPLRFLFLFSAFTALFAPAFAAAAPRVDPSTLTGKVMVGYQGWFNAEDDGARRGYHHWTRGNGKPAPSKVRIDLWPDLTDFPAAERFPTDLVHADGTRAEVFSSYLRPTVVRHFSWMQDPGIDGVFVPRFISSLGRGTSLAANHAVIENVRAGAHHHGRVYALMDDLSGLTPGKADLVIEDCKNSSALPSARATPLTCATTANCSSRSGAAASRTTTSPAPPSPTGARSSRFSKTTKRAVAWPS